MESSLSCLLRKTITLAVIFYVTGAQLLQGVKARGLPDSQEQNRYSTYSPGGADMRGVAFYRIRSVLPFPSARKKVIQVELQNSTGGWYVGGSEWFLWIGDSRFMRSNCMGDSWQLSEIVCFSFSMEEWKNLKQGDSAVLTWGNSIEDRNRTLPFARLDKKLLDKKPKKKVSR